MRDRPIRTDDDIRSPIFDKILDNTKPATHDDNVALARKVQAGDMVAAEEMLHRNMRFAILRAKQCHPPMGIDIHGWFQVAVFALWRAILKYDPDRGKLSSLARHYITHDLDRYKMEMMHAVRIPCHNWDAFNNTRSMTLDTDMNEDLTGMPGGMRWVDLLTTGHEPTDAAAEHWDQGGAIENMLGTLSKRERTIIIKSYGLDGEAPEALHVIGERVGVGRERVRQIRNEVLERVRENRGGRYDMLKELV